MNLKPIILLAALACFSGSLLISTQAQQPVPGRNSGSISGRITVDGKPKEGVVVELLRTDTNGPRRSIAKATTSKTGKYVLTNVESGTYDVSPSAPTLVVPNQGTSGQSGKSVTIETGESVKGIDFDLVSKGSISGRLRDFSGEPVKGQKVELILRGEDNYSRPFYSSAPDDHITNDEGVYRISGVPPGRYIVKVGTAYGLTAYGPSGKSHVYYPETFHPSADEVAKATVVEVATGRETSDVDITVGRRAVDGSASICSISVAKLKKVSALRKKPFAGLAMDLTNRMCLQRSDSVARVEKQKLTVPPSGLKPHAVAIASRKVDFPQPFSPK